MDTQPLPAAFFDIGNTLGSVRFSPQQPHRLERLDVYPQVPDVLQQLRDNGARLGIVSNIGQETEEDVRRVLEEAGLYDFFEPNLLIYGAKDSPEIFRRAAERAGHSASPERCVYIGEDRDERGYALEAGFRVAPHPRLAREALNGSRLRYIRVTVPVGAPDSDEWRDALLDLPVVPIHATGENGTTVYAIATSGAASQLDDLGFEVLRLGGEDLPLATEVYFLRDDRQTRTGFLVEEGESSRFFDREEESRMVLASSEGGLFVALPAGRSVLQYHFEEALHGHTVKLMPGMGLLEPSGMNQEAANLLATSGVGPALSQEEIETFHREITPQSIAADVDRYSGKKPTEEADGITVKSRHVQHEHNALAVAALALDLEEIGGDDFSVRLHRFTEVTTKGSYALDNVEAELVGSELQEMVLITAHLDSTAAFTKFEDREYIPDEDPAPGADDDGSGIAAVLAAARAIKRLSAVKRPKRTIRFVLFNAEEEGLVGSGEYARDQRALRAPIVAVYQMDMMGYNREAPRTYEIHAGADSQDVQDRSLVLAERIRSLSEQVSPNLPAPQIYLNKGLAQQDKDPAYNRSDHHSFHLVRYAACAATEDFFAGPRPDSPQSEGNPNYHQTSDTFVDPEYTADIARAVAAAAWATANL
jgi:bacterial leucyl aminopeptidase